MTTRVGAGGGRSPRVKSPSDPFAHLATDLAEAGDDHPVRLNLSSNNYLGLRDHANLRRAAIAAIERYGVGATAGRLAADETELHERLEARLAAFKGTEAALVFQSGFATNLGTIPAIVGRNDLVLYDEFSHASTLDGIRLSGATATPYRHRDVDQLEHRLREARGGGSASRRNYRTILVATDGVFGMDGDIAPLPAISGLVERFDAGLLVDDAHATGVLGANGRGTAEHLGVTGRVHLQVGTLSKALGAFGGFVGGDGRLCRFLSRNAHPVLYSTLLPPALVAASLAALELVEHEPERRRRLWSNTERLREGLARLGFDTGSSETPIVPVLLSSGDAARRFARHLRERGVLTQAVTDTPARRARLRLIVSSEHAPAELDGLLDLMDRVGRELAELR